MASSESSNDAANRPAHIAIIMDGNGRWAEQRGLPRLAGHRAGVENIRRIVSACVENQLQVLTIYAFSTENWGRPSDEVEGLMSLLQEVLRNETASLHRNGVRIRHLGELEGLSPSLRQGIAESVNLTANNSRLCLNVAFNYGGRDELVRAVRRIVATGAAPERIDEALISANLDTAGQPDPDFVVRTAGEMRLSNYLIWQSAYAEYYSTPVYWPDFDEAELAKALQAFAQRKRRFGKL